MVPFRHYIDLLFATFTSSCGPWVCLTSSVLLHLPESCCSAHAVLCLTLLHTARAMEMLQSAFPAPPWDAMAAGKHSLTHGACRPRAQCDACTKRGYGSTRAVAWRGPSLPSITCSPESSTAETTGIPSGGLQFGTGGDSWGQAAPAGPAALSSIRACAGECMASKLIALFICLIKLERCHRGVE